jgi:hypothetical protein
MVVITGAGFTPSSSAGGTTYYQVSPILLVTTTASQNVLVTGTVVLGSTSAGGASALTLGLCDFLPNIVVATPLNGIRVLQNEVVPMTLSYVDATPGAGTHQYALCAGTTSVNWNSVGGASLTAIAY